MLKTTGIINVIYTIYYMQPNNYFLKDWISVA